MTKLKLGAVSLGCDKNRVDTEKLLYRIKTELDCEIVNESAPADIIIINTCGFISDATQESIDTILDIADETKQDVCLIVTGCMVTRYKHDLVNQFPEVTAFFSADEQDALLAFLKQKFKVADSVCCAASHRILTTPSHYAYLRIADGCDNFCSYCTIPYIRGRYRSESIEDLVDETRFLLDNYYIKELDLVAQDVTRYGIDKYGKYALIDLLDKLTATEISKIRLNYCYPELVTDELLNYMADNPKICKYLDIPLQHIDDEILRNMNRKSRESAIRELLTKIRSGREYISVRSTFITGFPNESEAQHRNLIAFLQEYRLDNVGFFAYSREDGTRAADMSGQINGNTKKRRLRELKSTQQQIMNEMQSAVIGTKVRILVDGIDYDAQMFYGHDEYNAPDVDKKIYFTAGDVVAVGEYAEVRITGVQTPDYIGEKV